MRVVLFQIGDFNVYGYGFMEALGMILAVCIGMLRAKKYKLDADTLFNAAIAGIIGGLIGGKLMYWIVDIKSIIANPKLMLDLGSGFVVYGGLILGLLVPFIYLHVIKKVSAAQYLDIAVASIAFGQALGRIGCFLAGCCYGMEMPEGSWFAVRFPEGCNAPAGVPLFPSQLVSAAGDLLIFAVLVVLTNREKFAGALIACYMVLYSIGRFVIEFFRGDVERGQIGVLSTSQFIAIFTFAGGIALYFLLKKRNIPPLRRTGKAEKEESKQSLQEG